MLELAARRTARNECSRAVWHGGAVDVDAIAVAADGVGPRVEKGGHGGPFVLGLMVRGEASAIPPHAKRLIWSMSRCRPAPLVTSGWSIARPSDGASGRWSEVGHLGLQEECAPPAPLTKLRSRCLFATIMEFSR